MIRIEVEHTFIRLVRSKCQGVLPCCSTGDSAVGRIARNTRTQREVKPLMMLNKAVSEAMTVSASSGYIAKPYEPPPPPPPPSSVVD
jgi:hypothetical protein